MCWEVKETPYVQEVYGQTDGEHNAYKQTYKRAQAKFAYIEGSVPVVRGIAPYVRTGIRKSYDFEILIDYVKQEWAVSNELVRSLLFDNLSVKINQS